MLRKVGLKIILFVLCSLFANLVLAQKTTVLKKLFTQYTTNDGLSQNTVRFTFQDKRGFIWLATTYGLNRFDGNEFKTYTIDRFSTQALTNHWINAIEEDKKGRLWLATNGGGINILEADMETIRPLIDESKKFIKDDRIISLHFSNDSTLWIGSFKGLSRYNVNEETFIETPFMHKNNAERLTLVHEFMTEENGDTWIATDKGLYKWNSKLELVEKMVVYDAANVKKEADYLYRTIKKDSKGNYWVGTRMNGVFVFKKPKLHEAIVLQAFKYQKDIESKHITSIVTNYDGLVWIGARSGLYGYDINEDTLAIYTDDKKTDYRFKDEMVLKLFLDRHQNLWVASQTSGVYVTSLLKSQFNLVAINDLQSLTSSNRELWSVFSNSKEVWLGTDSKLFRFQENKGDLKQISPNKTEKKQHYEPKSVLSFFQEDKKGLWLASLTDGLVYYDYTTQLFRIENMQNKRAFAHLRIFSIIKKSDTRLLLGTQYGLLEYSLKDKLLSEIRDQSQNRIPAVYSLIHADDKGIWVGTASGLYYFEKKSNKLHFQSTPIEGEIDKSNHEINALWFNEQYHSLWMATSHGLVNYSVTQKKASFYGQNAGLPSNMILGLVYVPHLNTLWASTNKGLVKFGLNADGEMNDLKVYKRIHQHRLNEYNSGSFFGDSLGNIFFGGVSGLTYFSSQNRQKQNKQGEIQFYQALLQAGNKTEKVIIHNNSVLNSPSKTTGINLHFVYDDYTDPLGNHFFYRIRELREDWIPLNGAKVINLTNLSDGEYTIELINQHDLNVNESGVASIKLVQEPKIWNTLFFRLLVLMLISIVIYAYNRLRVKRLKEMNQELEVSDFERTRQLNETNERLSKSEELFRMITEHAGDLILLSNVSGEIQYCSPSSSTLLSYQHIDVVGKNIIDFIHPDDHKIIVENTKKIFKEGFVVFQHYRIKDFIGEWRYFSTTGNGIKNKDGLTEYVITVSHDITQQLRLSEIIKNAKEAAERANLAKSNFLASISHELRTPLNAILGYSQILADDRTMKSKQRDFAMIMYKSGDHLLSMINEILDLSKIEAGKMEVHNANLSLKTMLYDLVSIFSLEAKKKGLDLNIDLDAAIPHRVWGDSNKIRQIIINGLSNAMKFTKSGEIRLNAKVIGVQNDRVLLQICVEDTGIGIPKNQLASIFEPFKQVEGRFSQGTGLGLAICKKMAELLSGSIEMESDEGIGSRLIIKLPFKSADLITDDITQTKNVLPISYSGSSEVLTVLIVDDTETNLTLLHDILQPIGFNCLLAKDGINALKILYENRVDLVLLDIRMPIMSGDEVLAEIRKDVQFDSIPVIAITASGFIDSKQSFVENGFTDMLF